MRLHLPENFEKHLISLLLALLVVTMLAAAATRHLAEHLHPLILKSAAACLAWIASLGMARTAYLGLHTRITIIENLTSPGNRQRLNTLADIIFIVFAALAFALGVAVVAEAIQHPSPASHPFICMAVPTGAAVTIVRLVQRLQERFGE